MVDTSFLYIGYRSTPYRTKHGLRHWGDYNDHIDGNFLNSCAIPSIRLKIGY